MVLSFDDWSETNREKLREGFDDYINDARFGGVEEYIIESEFTEEDYLIDAYEDYLDDELGE